MINKRVYKSEELKTLHKIELEMLKDFDRVCQKYDIPYFAIAGTALGVIRYGGFIPWDDDIDVGLLRKDYERFLEVAPAELGDKYQFNGPDCENTYYNFVPNISLKGTKFIVDIAQNKYDIGIFLDIFIYENVPEDEKLAKPLYKKALNLRNLYVLSNINYFKFIKGEKVVMKIKYIICGIIHFILNLIPNIDKKIYKKYLKEVTRYNRMTEKYSILGDPCSRKNTLTKEEIFPIGRMSFEDMLINMSHKPKTLLKRRYGDYMKIPSEEQRVNHCPVEMDFGRYG